MREQLTQEEIRQQRTNYILSLNAAMALHKMTRKIEKDKIKAAGKLLSLLGLLLSITGAFLFFDEKIPKWGPSILVVQGLVVIFMCNYSKLRKCFNKFAIVMKDKIDHLLGRDGYRQDPILAGSVFDPLRVPNNIYSLEMTPGIIPESKEMDSATSGYNEDVIGPLADENSCRVN